MSYSNSFTTIVSTVLKRCGLQILSFGDNDFSILEYSSSKEEKFPMDTKPTEEELDLLVSSLNESPVVCECDEVIPNEDNC